MSNIEKIQLAKDKLEQLISTREDKLQTMLKTASILTELLEPVSRIDGYPIVVGGLSVEIYTQSDYTTRDIDFVTSSSDALSKLLLQVGFKKEGRIYYHEDIEVVVDIVSSALEGSYEKVVQLQLEDGSNIYVISIEDIILDRLHAFEHIESRQWGLKLLSTHFEEVDLDYIKDNLIHPKEKEILNQWIETIKSVIDEQT